MNHWATLTEPAAYMPELPKRMTQQPATRKPRARRVYASPWQLSPLEIRAVKAVRDAGGITRASEALNASLRTIEHQMDAARRKMGGVTLIQAVVMWDRFERGVA